MWKLLVVALGGTGSLVIAESVTYAGEPPSARAVEQYLATIKPILESRCFACHGEGAKEGGRAFDDYASDQALVGDTKLWWAVLKNVRAGIMPPPGEEQPTADERSLLFEWIKRDAFGIDPVNPDPGRPTLRRLNRIEYQNTVRDLLGVKFNATGEFPPDDAGYGFDNISDAMSVSPLLTEKYLTAARSIASQFEPKLTKAQSQAKAPREHLAAFVRRAYRRPVEPATIDRLIEIARAADANQEPLTQRGYTTAVAAVLASPRFLFRVEEPLAATSEECFPLVDEFTLAARLSYFLWSSTPDDELLDLAEKGQLRSALTEQVARMLKDERSQSLAANFAGQWLRARDIDRAELDPLAILELQDDLEEAQRKLVALRKARQPNERSQSAKPSDSKPPAGSPSATSWQDLEKARAEVRRLRARGGMFDDSLKRAIREETELYFDYVIREDRCVLELIDSNYTFVNATLAKHYDIAGVTGDAMRRVDLPAGSPRGGVLGQAAFLVATSNPRRTSPVKRGLFVLENVLGMPPPPPPPANTPPLEEAAAKQTDHPPTVRELQERHRRDPLCHSCHARMDPPGLALENFNALGMWRELEQGQPIDATATLLSGEKVTGAQQLKKVIHERHKSDFYRCLIEKLLTYALGRGLEFYDEHTVDTIVARLDRADGKSSALLMGVIESAPFQRIRKPQP